jgi:uncharacterized protein (TIGR02001 family)
MKRLAVGLRVAFVLVIAAAPSLGAPFDFCGLVAVTSEYVYRGVSQTNEGPALQAGVKLVVGPGF